MVAESKKQIQHKKREKRPPKKISERYLYNAGLYYLQRFPASSNHFRTVMMRKITKSCRHHTEQNKEDCAQMLENVVEKFQELGLLNDGLYTQGMVNSLRRSGKSEQAIVAKLRTKGVPFDLIKSHLQEHAENRHDRSLSAELKAAMIFARKKKIGPFENPDKKDDEHTRYKKALGMMARAGFSYDTCRIILSGWG